MNIFIPICLMIQYWCCIIGVDITIIILHKHDIWSDVWLVKYLVRSDDNLNIGYSHQTFYYGSPITMDCQRKYQKLSFSLHQTVQYIFIGSKPSTSTAPVARQKKTDRTTRLLITILLLFLATEFPQVGFQ